MRFRSYLGYKVLPLCLLGFAAVFVFIFLAYLEVKGGFIFFAEGTLFLFTGLWLGLGFWQQKKRFQKVVGMISQLEEKYLVGEVLPKPHDENELIYFELMKTISRNAISTVEKERQAREEYQSYVEGWIHEIKTPLTACSLILENDREVSKLRREIKKADNLTESILFYARMKNLEKDTLVRSIIISEVIDESIKDQMPLLIAAGISIERNGDFSVSTDEKALGFILKQLLCNSAKYCPGCHITITAENGVLFFEDNGIGIPEYELSRITDKGFTGKNGRRLGNSTGMGLYLANEFCRHLGITLSVTSEEGQFTRFSLSFDSLTTM